MRKNDNTLFRCLTQAHFVRFCAVGVLNTGIEFTVFNALLFVLQFPHFTSELLLAKALGFAAATLNSYVLNARITFAVHTHTPRHYLAFFTVSILGLGLNVLCAYIAYQMFVSWFDVPGLLAAQGAFAVATISSLLWNYRGYRQFVFKNV